MARSKKESCKKKEEVIKFIKDSLIKNDRYKEFFRENYTEIKFTVEGYKILKDVYDNRQINDSFQRIFNSFYAMSKLFVDESFIIEFYKRMNELKEENKNEYTPEDIVNDAEKLSGYIQTENSKRHSSLQLSFVTKMYNLKDNKYPIYDKMVATVFGIYTAHDDYKNNKKDTCVKWYRLIVDVYKELLKENDIENIITYFKECFDCRLASMRILDVIVWQLGKEIDRNKQK